MHGQGVNRKATQEAIDLRRGGRSLDESNDAGAGRRIGEPP